MTFYGAAEDLKELCEEKQNSIECILIDAFNRGWRANEKIISDMYKQADSAIEQKIINQVPAGQNPFIELLQKANKIKQE